MPSFTRDNTGIEVVKAFADRVDGKTIVITGASDHTLGGTTAEALAHANPAQLFLLARAQSRVDPVIARIKALNPKIKATFVPVTLDDFDSVRAAAATISGAIDKLDILINNAGIMAVDFATNKEGVERHFATNHLGHFLFTERLFPKILAAGPGARIINLTSLGHRFSPIRFDDYNFSNGAAYQRFLGYGQSKTANILFSVSLADKLRDKKITSFAVHPGLIVESNLASHLGDIPELVQEIKDTAEKHTGIPFPIDQDLPKTLEQGVTTTLVAALDPSIEAQSGSYLADAHIQTPFEWATNKENAERLWKLSEKLVGEKFDI